MSMTEEEQKKLKHKVAIKIAVDAGVLVRCETHADGVFAGSVAVTEAYTLANEQYSKNELGGVFLLRREMLELLEEVVPGYRTEECPYCTNNGE